MAPAKRPTFQCLCTSCGWKSARGTKNMHKPCPKCGGQVTFRSAEDKAAVQMWGIITAILMVIVGVVMTAVKPD